MEKITVLVPVHNEEEMIEDALKSVVWADEILIIDSGSKDKTLEICKRYKARILYHKYNYYAQQVNWGIERAKYNWVLLLDADERVTPELAQEIKDLLKKPNFLNRYKGCFLARRHYFLGKWLRHGGRYPLYNIRLFKKFCRLEDRLVHPHIILEKKDTLKLKNDVIHFSDRNFEQFLDKLNSYSTYEAEEAYRNLKKQEKITWRKVLTNYLFFKSTIKKFWIRLPLAGLLRFLYMYIFRLGFLDGYEGFIIALFYGFNDAASKVKFKELIKKNARY